MGFCLGGGFALAMGQGWGAVSANYGDVPRDDLLRGLPPTIACAPSPRRARRSR